MIYVFLGLAGFIGLVVPGELIERFSRVGSRLARVNTADSVAAQQTWRHRLDEKQRERALRDLGTPDRGVLTVTASEHHSPAP